MALSHSVSECQSDKCKAVGNFDTKLVAKATSLEESEKLDLVKKIRANTFHLVKRS